MTSSTDLGTLLQRAQAGDQDAAIEFYNTCRNPLRRAIRGVLTRHMRKLFDSEDFLQEAFADIFEKKFAEDVLASPHRLFAYLEKIAQNNVREATRKYLLTARYGIGGECALAGQEEIIESCEDRAVLNELLLERLSAYVAALPPVYQAIVALILKGKSPCEIAPALGMTVKEVYRAAERAKKKLSDQNFATQSS
jgi:RNA polymerase sigma factor (sigma-70 family)